MLKFETNNREYLIVVLVFLFISAIYFSPVLKGYTIKMGDIKNWKGMAKETKDYKKIYGKSALWTNTSFSGMPTYQIVDNYLNPIKKIYNALVKILSLPVFAFFVAFLSFYVLAKSFNAGLYMALIGSIAYGMSSYNVLILEAGHVSKLMAIAFIPGVIGGVVYLFRNKHWVMGFSVLVVFLTFELLVNHVQMTYYFGLVILAVLVAEFIQFSRDNRYKDYFVKTAIILGAAIIGILANFANYSNTYLFAKKTTRGNPVITINPEGENVETNHSKGLNRDYIVQWSYGKSETWNLIIPNAKGDRTVFEKMLDRLKTKPALYNYVVKNYSQSGGKLFGAYWGDQPFSSGPNYIGAIIVLLAVLYLLFVHNPLKWSLLGVSLLALLLSWGKNLGGSVEGMWLTNFFIDYVPLYSKFRTVSSILVVLNLTIPLMALLFLVHLANHTEWANRKLKHIALAGLGVVAITFAVVQFDFIGFSSEWENSKINQLEMSAENRVSGITPTEVLNQVETIRKEIVLSDTWRSVLLMLASLGLIVVYVSKESYRNIVLGSIALLVLIDLWNVDKRYLNNQTNPRDSKGYLYWEKNTEFSNTFDATKGDLDIFKIESNSNPQIEIDYQNYLSGLDRKARRGRKQQESAMFAALNFNTNYKVMDLDNPFNSARVSYFHKSSGGYNPAKLKRYQDMIDFYISKELMHLNSKSFEKMKVMNMLNNKYYLYKGQLAAINSEAMGNAWFVDSIHWVEDNNSEILAISATDVKHTAIVHKEFAESVKAVASRGNNDRITMTSYSPMNITYESNTQDGGLAVFSEVYYEDGWNAYIDDKTVDYVRANYILRAMNIPKGKHKIEFRFEPVLYTIGNVVNIIGFILILISVSTAFYITHKNTK